MHARKLLTIIFLVLSSVALSGAKPAKSELESMYDKAFHAFDDAKYDDALKALDAIDKAQPDLAESYNLRGVVYMRQEKYDKAEAALRKALSIEPRFWNASFNLAEIPFLQKKWPEARNRFEALMAGDNGGLQPETTQLIQYKILLTFVLQGKENTVDWILNKFEATKESPALYYSNAAIAFQHGNKKEAQEWITAASKQFAEPLNKLYAESFYEVGWMEKPAGEGRAALEITSTTERAERLKADAKANYEKAERAFQQRDFPAALKALDLAEAGHPNDAASLNLRGEILMEQKKYDEAEVAFHKAVTADPKFREAQYNLAQIPFKKGEYQKARDRFEALFAETPGGDQNQAAQLIRYKIFMTLLLQGKEQEAQQLMDQFKFTGDTPALYYAQAAWEFKHAHPDQGNDWVVSARKIYSPPLNIVFADSFYDLGWLQQNGEKEAPPTAALAQADATPGTGTKPALRFGQAEAGAPELTENGEAKPAGSPAASPAVAAASPASGSVPSAPAQARASVAPVVAAAKPGATRAPASTAGKVAAASAAAQPALGASATGLASSRNLLVGALLLAGILLLVWLVVQQFRRNLASVPLYDPAEPLTDPPLAGDEPTAGDERRLSRDHLSSGPPKVSVQLKGSEAPAPAPVLPSGPITARGATPGVQEPASAPLEKAAIRGIEPGKSVPPPVIPADGMWPPTVRAAGEVAPPAKPAEKQPDVPAKPEKISAKTVEPVRPSPAPSAKPEEPVRSFVPPSEKRELPAQPALQPSEKREEPGRSSAQPSEKRETAPTPVAAAAKPAEISAKPPEIEAKPAEVAAKAAEAPARTETAAAKPAEVPVKPVEVAPKPVEVAPKPAEVPAKPAEVAAAKPEVIPPKPEPITTKPVEATPKPEEVAAAAKPAPPQPEEKAPKPEVPAVEPEKIAAKTEEAIPEPDDGWTDADEIAAEVEEAPFAQEEPVGQGRPIPHLTTAFSAEPVLSELAQPEPESELVLLEPEAGLAGPIAVRQPSQSSIESPSFASKIITTEPIRLQPTTSDLMPETSLTPASASQSSSPTMSVQQPVGGMHTAVQLTFALEIASMQLTPTFKMSGLQLKPMSNVVSMRLAPSQDPQPPMNLQVTFEVAKIDLSNGTIGTIRLTPSGQQKPALITSPSFAISGLELMAGSGAAPVQLTPSHQEQASVQLTAQFQIAAIEFTPLFEIATIVLNSTSKKVSMQLPGAGASTIDNAPVFEIENVQVGGGGSELGMIQVAPGR